MWLDFLQKSVDFILTVHEDPKIENNVNNIHKLKGCHTNYN